MIVKKKLYQRFSIVFLLLSALPLYFFSTLSKGNFLAGPVSIIMCIPLIIIQSLIVWVIWRSRVNQNLNFVLIILSFLIGCFEMFLLYKYFTIVS